MIRVFLVDEQVVLREGLRSLVGTQPDMVVVGEASTGRDLLRHLPTVPMDVVVLDYHLPGKDGLATIQHLREHYPQVRILVLSLLSGEADVVALFAAGAQGYLLKHAHPAELLHGLRRVGAGHQFLCTELGLAALRQPRETAGLSNCGAPEKPLGLTKREVEVLRLTAAGLTSGEMADQLFLSKRTIETHRQHLMEKTQARNTAALIKFALCQGLLPGLDNGVSRPL